MFSTNEQPLDVQIDIDVLQANSQFSLHCSTDNKRQLVRNQVNGIASEHCDNYLLSVDGKYNTWILRVENTTIANNIVNGLTEASSISYAQVSEQQNED